MKKASKPDVPCSTKKPPPPPAPPKSRFSDYSELLNAVPTNWCDPLLTGPGKVLPDGYTYKPDDIERLLLAIRKRMEKILGI